MGFRRAFSLVLVGFFAPLVISGCSGKGSDEGERVPPAPPAPSAREVIKEYTDTLVSAPKSARSAADATEEAGRRTEKAIRELE